MQMQFGRILCGILMGLIALAWIRPVTEAGSILVIVLALLLVQAVPPLAGVTRRLLRRQPATKTDQGGRPPSTLAGLLLLIAAGYSVGCASGRTPSMAAPSSSAVAQESPLPADQRSTITPPGTQQDSFAVVYMCRTPVGFCPVVFSAPAQAGSACICIDASNGRQDNGEIQTGSSNFAAPLGFANGLGNNALSGQAERQVQRPGSVQLNGPQSTFPGSPPQSYHAPSFATPPGFSGRISPGFSGSASPPPYASSQQYAPVGAPAPPPSGQQGTAPYPSAAHPAAPPAPQPARRLHPARVFMPAKDIPPAGVGAYGVVALRNRPTPATADRLTMACKSFLATLPPQAELPDTVSLADQMLTIWPLTTTGNSGVKAEDCPSLLAHYDLDGGLSAIADAETQDRHLDGRGPFLIGWSPSNMRGVPDAIVLIVDMSDFESQQSFDEAFLFWQRKIVEDPQLWRTGFSLERMRLAVRDFVDHYGKSIEAAIKIWVRKG